SLSTLIHDCPFRPKWAFFRFLSRFVFPENTFSSINSILVFLVAGDLLADSPAPFLFQSPI
ncbi:MAG: hypothetical protein J6S92_01765, partial [Oscillospiraceae bacterium]|nr:hypothetical protein [Oscillospiraceae bacterium]